MSQSFIGNRDIFVARLMLVRMADLAAGVEANRTLPRHERTPGTLDSYHTVRGQALELTGRAWQWACRADAEKAANLVHLADYNRIPDAITQALRDVRSDDPGVLRDAARRAVAPLIADLVKADALVTPQWETVTQDDSSQEAQVEPRPVAQSILDHPAQAMDDARAHSTPPAGDELLTAAQLRVEYSVTPDMLRKARTRGKLPGSVKRGGRWLYPRSKVLKEWPG
ncbi:MAG: hypothetical protein JJU36_07900 [Phycisphaeraceae bacterium]|nr:hypothetical protein [Phycisphaeraceae bacterium]